MAVTPNSIITAQVPTTFFYDLSAASAVTSRAPITGTAGLTAASSTISNINGRQIISASVKAISSAQSSSGIQQVYLWQYDGTKSWLVDELTVVSIAASITSPSYSSKTNYTDWILPAGHQLYVSTTLATIASTTALLVQVNAGDL